MPLVISSVVREIEYEDLTAALDITFSSGKTYTYYLVPRDVYERFVAASSKGEFFNEQIKNRYSFRQKKD